MKILAVSDTHGSNENLKTVLKKTGTPDCLIHLGDSECGELGIRQLADCPMHMVAGNCDFFCDLPRTKIIEIEGFRIFLTHGHYYYVTAGMRDLIVAAKQNECELAIFGHTHRPMICQKDPCVTVLNPGSLSRPRQEGYRPSYMILELEAGREPVYEICYL